MPSSHRSLVSAVRRFGIDFARFAGVRGLGALALVAAGALLEGVGLTLLLPILSLVSGARTPGWPGRVTDEIFALLSMTDPTTRLAIMLGGFLALLLLRGLVTRARDIEQTRLQMGFIERQRLDVIQALTKARWETVERLRHGRITQAMSGDILRVATASNVLIQTAVSVVIIAVQGGLAFALSPSLTIVAALFALVTLATLIPWLRRAFAAGGGMVNLNGEIMNATTQYLGGMKLAVSQNLQGGYLGRFETALAQLRDQQVDLTRRQAARRTAISTAGGVAGALILFVGLRVLNIPPLVLLAVLALLARASGPAGQIQQSAQVFAQALPTYLQVRELCDELRGAATSGGASSASPETSISPRPSVSLRGLAYQRDGAPVLRGLDLDLPPGGFIGVMGSSGAGKSTLADLLVGLLAHAGGEIAIDGVRLDPGGLTAWRDRLAYVSQDPFLFHDTVRANLLWGAAAETQEDDLWRALTLVGAEPLVRGMAQGLDTVVGERGTLISGGERQRLALARAVLRRPALLILDEATNAIDIAGEALVLTALRELAPRPTILLIAHRQESFAQCDRVLSLEDGTLREVLETVPVGA